MLNSVHNGRKHHKLIWLRSLGAVGSHPNVHQVRRFGSLQCCRLVPSRIRGFSGKPRILKPHSQRGKTCQTLILKLHSHRGKPDKLVSLTYVHMEHIFQVKSLRCVHISEMAKKKNKHTLFNFHLFALS